MQHFLIAATDGKLKSGSNAAAKTIPKEWIEENWNRELTDKEFKDMPLFQQAGDGKAGIVARKSINDRVFEALGSFTNRKNFVMLEKELNGMKENFWGFKKPMGEATKAGSMIKQLIDHSVTGAEPTRNTPLEADRKKPANKYLTVMRDVSPLAVQRICTLTEPTGCRRFPIPMAA
jgi:hypothetical protein